MRYCYVDTNIFIHSYIPKGAGVVVVVVVVVSVSRRYGNPWKSPMIDVGTTATKAGGGPALDCSC